MFSDGTPLTRDVAAYLMRSVPAGLAAAPAPPAEFSTFFVRQLARDETALLAQMRERTGTVAARTEELFEFWTRTVPAALDRPFADRRAWRDSLRELDADHFDAQSGR